ncbi:MAG: pseudouridine synthase [Lachnospiraceae bacterium]|nr:pseudouridine synthase [Lachnospiraceae bacterium]
MKKVRLDKYICQSTMLTRSQAKEKLKAGAVRVNDILVKKAETKVDPEADQITLDGRSISMTGMRYYLLNKPQGVITATRDDSQKTVMDLIHEPVKDLAPVGRLDKDTEGLLLITNDGALTHSLLSPKKHVNKCYFAVLDGPITEEDIKAFREGLDIGDEKKTLPAKLELAELEMLTERVRSLCRVDDQEKSELTPVLITIQEGRYHQVKRMAQAVGNNVVYLKRMSMGGLVLDPSLEPGSYRELSEQELQLLRL